MYQLSNCRKFIITPDKQRIGVEKGIKLMNQFYKRSKRLEEIENLSDDDFQKEQAQTLYHGLAILLTLFAVLFYLGSLR